MRFFRALVGVVMVFACLAGSDAVHAQLDRLRKHKAPHPEPLAAPPSIVIPEGEFLMGATGPDALEDEKPQHAVWLDRFEIDLHEVTTAHYAEFLATLSELRRGNGRRWISPSITIVRSSA